MRGRHAAAVIRRRKVDAVRNRCSRWSMQAHMRDQRTAHPWCPPEVTSAGMPTAKPVAPSNAAKLAATALCAMALIGCIIDAPMYVEPSDARVDAASPDAMSFDATP